MPVHHAIGSAEIDLDQAAAARAAAQSPVSGA
jgi:hypothetical protein